MSALHDAGLPKAAGSSWRNRSAAEAAGTNLRLLADLYHLTVNGYDIPPP